VKTIIHKRLMRRIRRLIQPLNAVGVQLTRPFRQMATLNLAPLTGRRDAASSRFAELIREDIFTLTEPVRYEAYGRLIALLEEVIESTAELGNHHDTRRREAEKNLLSYFTLLRDMLQTSADLLAQQLLLEPSGSGRRNEAHELFVSRQSAGKILADSELQLYQSVCTLVELSRPQTVKYQEYVCKLFPKQGGTRYQRASEEYRQFFATHFPGIPQPAPELMTPSDRKKNQASGKEPIQKA